MYNQFFTIKPRISEKRLKQSCTPNKFGNNFYISKIGKGILDYYVLARIRICDVSVCVCVCVCVCEGLGRGKCSQAWIPRRKGWRHREGMTGEEKVRHGGKGFVSSFFPIYYLFSPTRCRMYFSLSYPLRCYYYYSRSLFLPLRSLFLLRFNFIK